MSDGQAKVSMIIPCYNKVNFIDRMFASVRAQKYDNIEVVLSIRKSSDGTDEKITEWIPRLLDRGYAVVCIHGENISLPTGVLAGLKRATGDYICQINADDWISDDYVSTPVEFLESNGDCQYTICDLCIFEGATSRLFPFWVYREETEHLRVEDFILHAVHVTNVALMIRSDYFAKAGILDDFYIGTTASPEAQIFLPLISLGGKFKYFPKPMYYFDMTQPGEQMSGQTTLDGAATFILGYADAVRATINKIDMKEDKTAYCLNLNELTALLKILEFCQSHNIGIGHTGVYGFAERASALLKKHFHFKNDISLSALIDYSGPLRVFIGRKALGIPQGAWPSIPKNARVIVCGCLGKIGSVALKFLPQVGIAPDLLWDNAATGAEIFAGIPITKPDYSQMQNDDAAIVAVAKNNFRDEIISELKAAGCQHIYDYPQIANTFCESLFEGKSFPSEVV